ncbi:hypothetical protein DXX93_01805 [Thalassotalea euphylliae]|uniref:Uncharacterized protein n=1 Tax=Thalassotalea euphylliae TaxID=1655234 RepID=A0A3E0TM27_9GAMM|nr:hypothetical protein [Thalassotalea euphylliae]REL25407.1 hypothetical protein DXX93_01805 [Thalassotalea euphylliae]
MLWQLLRSVLLIGLLAANFELSANNILITDIVKSADASWSVTYRSQTPVQSIQFHHSPDDSRFERWQLISDGFSFRKLNGKDTVFKQDGSGFTSVTFALTPTYIHLPKSYAPFAPYSDGSVLLHSGRFFACATLCRSDENLWYLTLSAPANERIVLNGLSANNKVSWYDENDGRKVFVGNTEITETNHYIAVIDNALPPALISALEEFIPNAMVAMASRFPALGQKPMLFASFGKTKGQRYGRQGGVLPDQIFMHWYGQLKVSNPYDLIWFYAHEVTHLYQGGYVNSIENDHAWIHEGHAEFVAGELLMQFYPQATSFVEQKRFQAQQDCKAKLAKFRVEEFAAHQEYHALYQCGAYFYQLLAEYSGSAEKISYDFWLGLGQKASDKGNVDKDVALAVANLFLTEQNYQRVLREFGW